MRALWTLLLVPCCLAQFNLEGIDGDALNNLMEDAGKTNSDAVVIYNGETRVGVWTFGKELEPLDAEGITASIAALAIGMLIEEGKIASLDERLVTWYPSWKGTDKEDITLRHLLAQTTGLGGNPTTDASPAVAEDLIAYALEAPKMAATGEIFFDNPRPQNLIGGIIAKAAGKGVDAYLAEKLFTPLGIESARWSKDGAGNVITMTGLEILPDDLAEIGVMLMNKGRWQDKQIVPSSFLETSLAKGSDETQNAGLMWYLIFGETIYVIDDALLDSFRAADVDPAFIEGMSRLKGRYNGRTAVYAMFIGAFGKNWQNAMQKYLGGKGLRITNREYANRLGFNAPPRNGQWLVIFPDKGLVGVRMIAPDSIQEPDTDKFLNFGNQLLQLIPED